MRAILRSIILILFFSGDVLPLRGQDNIAIDSLRSMTTQVPDTGKASALYAVGNAYYLQGMNDSAGYYFNQSLSYAQKYNASQKVCLAYLAMARCYMHLDKQDTAITLLFKSKEISENKNLLKETATAGYLVSIIYDYQNRVKDALQFSLESERIFTRLKDTAGLLSLYTNMVSCLGKSGDTSKALGYYRNCLSLFDRYEHSSAIPADVKENIRLNRMALLFNSADVMTNPSDLAGALGEVEKMRAAIEKGNNEYEKFELYTLLAVINLKLRNYKEAQQQAGDALKYIRPESGNFEQVGDLYHIIADASAGLQEYDKAYAALNEYKRMNDSTYNSKSLEAIHSVQEKYETAKKEEKIISLNKEKKTQRLLIIGAIAGLCIAIGLLVYVIRFYRLQKKLMLKEKEAQQAVVEKKLFELEQTALRAQMNPHFIFNSLNSVQRFIINHDTVGVNDYLSVFARLIRQTLDNSGKQEIALADELQYLDTYLRLEQLRSNNGFRYEMILGEGIHPEEIFIPNMLLQPYLENCVLHAFVGRPPTENKITVRITLENNLIIELEDNGIGLSKAGSKEEKEGGHLSKGRAITEKRIELYNSLHDRQITCKVEDIRETDAARTGTRVSFIFPV